MAKNNTISTLSIGQSHICVFCIMGRKESQVLRDGISEIINFGVSAEMRVRGYL